MGTSQPSKKTLSHNKRQVARKLSRSQKLKRQIVEGAKAKFHSKLDQKSDLSRAESTPSFTNSPHARPSTGKFGAQGQVTRTLIRAQKTNWPSATSRTEGKVESKRNPTVRRNKRSGKS